MTERLDEAEVVSVLPAPLLAQAAAVAMTKAISERRRMVDDVSNLLESGDRVVVAANQPGNRRDGGCHTLASGFGR